ncbi:MAG: putative hemolysin [Chlamydiales bacterium]
MNPHPPAALLGSALPPAVGNDLTLIASMALALLASALFSTLRFALQHSHPGRVLGMETDVDRRARLTPLLERVEALATSAGIFKIACDVVFVTILLGGRAASAPLEWTHVATAFAIAAPLLLLLTDALPQTIARARGSELLLRTLPSFVLLQVPLRPFVSALEAVRRAVMRILGLRDSSSSTRKIVEGLRDVIEESAQSGDLNEGQREIIENVMDFCALDAAAVMTPRTEIFAVDIEDGLSAVVRALEEAGHSRIPIYKDSVDSIIGTVTALEVAKVLGADSASTRLEDLMRPPFLVPETKPVSELLAEFRAHKQKMAIVLDEYGGTAGVVTLGDVIAEIVGDIHDEYEESQESMRFLEGGAVEILASVHVTEVNEALGLEIPAGEDFETLGGFVLAELGHFPKRGEEFTHGNAHYAVLDASDRRVLKVSVKKSA